MALSSPYGQLLTVIASRATDGSQADPPLTPLASSIRGQVADGCLWRLLWTFSQYLDDGTDNRVELLGLLNSASGSLAEANLKKFLRTAIQTASF